MTPMRIYLAGPEVFLPDARAVGAAKKALCARMGHEGVFPLDEDGPEEWRAIAARCESMIRRCDALVANLSPFRGTGADPGTVYELGFARALGLPVRGYTADARELKDRVAPCPHAMAIEDFGLAENLMLEGAIAATGGHLVRLHADDPWRDLAPLATALRQL